MSVTLDKRVKKNKDGISRYRVRLNYTDANGKPRQIERLVWGKAEANLVERELEAEYKDKRVVVPSKMTLDELFEKYSKHHANETRKTSHETVMKCLRLRVLPYLKEQRLDKLDQSVLDEWKITIGNTNLSTRSKQNTYKTFVAMLNYAVKMGFIPKNNLSVLGNFRDNLTEIPSKEPVPYTSQEFEQYISAAKSCCKTVNDGGFYVFF